MTALGERYHTKKNKWAGRWLKELILLWEVWLYFTYRKMPFGKEFCCGNGCRYFLYQYESVPESKRSQLIEQAENKK